MAACIAMTGLNPVWSGGMDSPLGRSIDPAKMVQRTEYFDLQQASALINQEKYADAVPYLKAAIEKAPTNLLAHFNLALAYMEWAKQTEEKSSKRALLKQAEEAFLRVESLNSHYPITYFKLGKIALLLDEPDRAEAYYRQGLELEPENAGLLFNLAGIYDQKGDFEAAIAYYQQAIQSDPDFAFAYNNLGLVYERLKKYDMAEAAYKSAMQKDPTYVFAQLNLGNLYAEQDRLSDAALAYQQVLKMQPQDPWAHMYLGNIALKQGDFKAAELYYQASIQLNPDYATTYYLMAVTLERLKKYDEALSMGMKYLYMAPKGEFAPEVKSLVIDLKNQTTATLRLVPKDSRLACCDP